MKKEIITLTLPAKPRYMMTVRLVAASIAGQAGFDVEEIEDVKSAVAEACLLLMSEGGVFTLHLEQDDGIRVRICVEENGVTTPETEEQRFGTFLLEALMDEAVLTKMDGIAQYSLYKALREVD